MLGLLKEIKEELKEARSGIGSRELERWARIFQESSRYQTVQKDLEAATPGGGGSAQAEQLE